MSKSNNVVQFVMSVTVVAVMSHAAKEIGLLRGAGSLAMVIKGFLTFFCSALLYFPVSLMLGGIAYRNRFFERP